VSGSEMYTGGLVGEVYEGTIKNSYSTGEVSGEYICGGLVGDTNNSITENSYSTGKVVGSSNVGGLVGYHAGGTIKNSYSTGEVSGSGGLIGYNRYSGNIENSYWAIESSGQDNCVGSGSDDGCIGLDKESDFYGTNNPFHSIWDLENIWTDTNKHPRIDLSVVNKLTATCGACVEKITVEQEKCAGELPAHAAWYDTSNLPYNPLITEGSKTAVRQADNDVPEKTNCDFNCENGYTYKGEKKVMAGGFVGWGQNNYGQVGLQKYTDLVQVVGNGFHTLGLTAEGEIVGWGNNDDGGLVAVFDGIPAGKGYKAISSDWYTACAIDKDGYIKCWGKDYLYVVRDTPKDSGFIDVKVGYDFVIALHSTGYLKCWGSAISCKSLPSASNFTAIEAGDMFYLTLNNKGEVFPQLSKFIGNDYIAIAAGDKHMYALKKDGSILATGSDKGYEYDFSGTLRDAMTNQVKDTPTEKKFTKIAAHGNTGYALDKDGFIYVWGENRDGKVKNKPTDGGYTDINAGDLHSFAIKGVVQTTIPGVCVQSNQEECEGELPEHATWYDTSNLPNNPFVTVGSKTAIRQADNNVPEETNCDFDCEDNYIWEKNSTDQGIAIYDCEGLQNMRDNLTADYYLVKDIDCIKTKPNHLDSTSLWKDGEGFEPVGNNVTPFTGSLNGNCHTISNFYIDRTFKYRIGLFGYTAAEAKIQNLKIHTSSISTSLGLDKGKYIGEDYPEDIGTVVGLNQGLVKNVHVYGQLFTAGININWWGGLVGQNNGIIENSSFIGDLRPSTGTEQFPANYIGGLVGDNFGTIKDSYTNAYIVVKDFAGGLVAENNKNSLIENSYAIGTIHGQNTIGGLAGIVIASQGIKNSLASVTTNGINEVGGLIGNNWQDGLIDSKIVNTYWANTGGATKCIGIGDERGCIATTQPEVFGNNFPFYKDKTWDFSNTWVSDSTFPVLDTKCDRCIQHITGICQGPLPANAEWWNKDDLPNNPTWYNYNIDDEKTSIQKGIDDPLQSCDFDCKAGFDWKAEKLEEVIKIKDCQGLQNMRDNLSATAVYYLDQDINCSDTINWNNDGQGFEPVGKAGSAGFAGTLHGNCFTITGLYINRPTQDHVGLFGILSNMAKIENVKLKNVNINGNIYVGGIAGDTGGGSAGGVLIENSYVTGKISGRYNVGGLVGQTDFTATIRNAYSEADVSANESRVGGLVGNNLGAIVSSYATGRVSAKYGARYLGGGSLDLEKDIVSYAGGLVGLNIGNLNDVYATGTVTGTSKYIGGLIGSNGGTVKNGYASGNVIGPELVGGLSGSNGHGNFGDIENVFSVGMVTNGLTVGGLVGQNTQPGTIFQSYWDRSGSGIPTCVGLDQGSSNCTDKSRINFYSKLNSPMVDTWDFKNVWEEHTDTYPTLRNPGPICGQCVYLDDGTGDGGVNKGDGGDTDTSTTVKISTGVGISTTISTNPSGNVSTYTITNYDLYNRLRGRFMMLPWSHGETYYVDQNDYLIHYLANATDAYTILGTLGVGITPVDLDKFKPAYIPNNDLDTDGDGLSDKFELSLDFNPNSEDTDGDGYDDKLELESNNSVTGPGPAKYDFTFAANHVGNIYLDVVGGHGEAWYINPVDNLRYYLGTPADAFAVMKNLAIGVSEVDFNALIGQ
jgi:alpha-tubulin suppressor-like RCC1 family protein